MRKPYNLHETCKTYNSCLSIKLSFKVLEVSRTSSYSHWSPLINPWLWPPHSSRGGHPEVVPGPDPEPGLAVAQGKGEEAVAPVLVGDAEELEEELVVVVG